MGKKLLDKIKVTPLKIKKLPAGNILYALNKNELKNRYNRSGNISGWLSKLNWKYMITKYPTVFTNILKNNYYIIYGKILFF